MFLLLLILGVYFGMGFVTGAVFLLFTGRFDTWRGFFIYWIIMCAAWPVIVGLSILFKILLHKL